MITKLRHMRVLQRCLVTLFHLIKLNSINYNLDYTELKTITSLSYLQTTKNPNFYIFHTTRYDHYKHPNQHTEISMYTKKKRF